MQRVPLPIHVVWNRYHLSVPAHESFVLVKEDGIIRNSTCCNSLSLVQLFALPAYDFLEPATGWRLSSFPRSIWAETAGLKLDRLFFLYTNNTPWCIGRGKLHNSWLFGEAWHRKNVSTLLQKLVCAICLITTDFRCRFDRRIGLILLLVGVFRRLTSGYDSTLC